MDGSVACAARCLASSAFRRQVSLSDDIRGGSSNAPNQAASRCVGSSGHGPRPGWSWQVPGPSFTEPTGRGAYAIRALPDLCRGITFQTGSFAPADQPGADDKSRPVACP